MRFLRSGALRGLARSGREDPLTRPSPAGESAGCGFSPRNLEREGPVAELSPKSWESKKQHEAWVGYSRMKTVSYISRRPSMAFSMVTSSANSSSDPTGIPMAMRLTVTPRGLMSLEM
jgi:hypothetical protein